jgi:predicted O-linked N-acetylglucosamine transferase (SPINDLY family)
MNRKQRRALQSQTGSKSVITYCGNAYTVAQARTLALQELSGQPLAALDICQLIIAAEPAVSLGYHDRSIILQRLNRYEDALTSIDKAIELQPDSAEFHNDRGNVLYMLNRVGDALASYDKAIKCKPDYADAYNNRGNILYVLKREEDALVSYDNAIALRPSYAAAHCNRGNALRALRRLDEALTSFDKAVALKPEYAEAHNYRGLALIDMRRLHEALASIDKAIALAPGYAEAYNNRGLALRGMQRYEEALASYTKAAALKPDIPYLLGTLFHTSMMLCQWRSCDKLVNELETRIAAGKPASPPLVSLTMPLSEEQQRKCAEIYINDLFPPSTKALWNGEKYSHNRIRIGYFSSDFFKHATSYLTAGLFEHHDRSRFEVCAFSYGVTPDDAMRHSLTRAFDQFLDVSAKSDWEVAALARSMEIDIAVDIKGLTGDGRTGIFALRPAPVQVNYLGYPGTMGAAYLDYVIADAVVLPEKHKHCFTERIAYLPDSYQVNDSSRSISANTITRNEAGLPDAGFIFCCFNNSYKVTPEVFDIWMRMLHSVPGSVLWLFEGNQTSARNLRAEAEARGIPTDRLVFAKPMELPDHLARQRLADLFLDTLPCNAHTTASDALWAGLPVLTCLGETFAGRVAASLLYAVGLPELVTRSLGEYEALALALATDPQRLSSIRQKLAQNRTTHPLFNTGRTTKHIEELYVRMLERSHAGLPPHDICLPP